MIYNLNYKNDKTDKRDCIFFDNNKLNIISN